MAGRDRYVTSAQPECEKAGCQLAGAAAMLQQARDLIEQHTGRNHMSQALWCDATDHPFSARDPERQRISITVYDDDGNELLEARDFCGPCATAAGLVKPKKGKYDALKTRILERQAGIVTDDTPDPVSHG